MRFAFEDAGAVADSGPGCGGATASGLEEFASGDTMLRKSDCVELKMSVDDALKYVISMGVVAPSKQ